METHGRDKSGLLFVSGSKRKVGTSFASASPQSNMESGSVVKGLAYGGFASCVAETSELACERLVMVHFDSAPRRMRSLCTVSLSGLLLLP